MQQENTFYATGRRKTAIARTWIKPGNGQITINNLPAEKYFPIETTRNEMTQPFKITNTAGSYDVRATVVGGRDFRTSRGRSTRHNPGARFGQSGL